jgi:hypothetical protein
VEILHLPTKKKRDAAMNMAFVKGGVPARGATLVVDYLMLDAALASGASTVKMLPKPVAKRRAA